MMYRLVLGMAWIGLVPWGHAAEPGEDFAEGFRRFAELGMPDLAGATWSEAPAPLDARSYTNQYEFRSAGIRLRGELWKTAGGDYVGFGSTLVTPAPEAPPVESDPKEQNSGGDGAAGLLRDMIRRYQENKPKEESTAAGPAATPPPKPLVERDVEALVEKLSSAKLRGEIGERLEYGRAEFAGRVLLFAVQLHQAGHAGLANGVASALFEASHDRTAFVDAAVDQLANEQFGKVTETFFQGYDWKSYLGGLRTLIDRFPRGWNRRLAVALLLPAVESRAVGAPVPEPSLPDLTLAPAALGIIRGWTELPESPDPAVAPDGSEIDLSGVDLSDIDLSEFPPEVRRQMLRSLRNHPEFAFDSSDLWTLGPAKDDGEGVVHPEGSIQALGLDGLLALAALVGDETLTYLRNPEQGSYYWSSSSSPMDRARREFGQMPRPLSRGEVAVRLLRPVVPGEFDEDDDPVFLQESAIAFWKENHDRSPLELCRIYLAEGSSSQQQRATRFLLELDDSEADEAFEHFALKSAEPAEIVSHVESYLTARKADARPFYEAFSKRLREAYEAVPQDELRYWGGYSIREAGGIDPYLKRLGMLVGASSLEELIADACNADDDNAWEGLESAIRPLALAEMLVPFATAIAGAEGRPRTKLLETLASRSSSPSEADEDSPLNPQTEPLPDPLVAAWKPLVEDASPLVAQADGTWLSYLHCRDPGTAAAVVLEFACNSEARSAFATSMTVHDDKSATARLTLERARARLAGSEPPPFPSAETVTEERRREIAGLADGADPRELRTRVLELRPDERAAWLEWRENLSNHDEAEAPQALRLFRQTVTTLRSEAGENEPAPDPAILEELRIAPGTLVDAPTIERIADQLLESADHLSGVVVHLNSAPMWLGLEAQAIRSVNEKAAWLKHLAQQETVQAADAKVDAFALASIDGGERQVLWCRRDGKIEPLTEKQDEEFPAFTSLNQFLESSNLYVPSFTFVVLKRDDLAQYSADE